MKYTELAKKLFLNTGTRFPREIIWAMGVIKFAAAKANYELGNLSKELAEPIMAVSKELAEGSYDDLIVVDVFQTGSGTGLNMNVNEVIAKIVKEKFGVNVHPNDHVNRSQSSNDVVPTAIRLAALKKVNERLKPALSIFVSELGNLTKNLWRIPKPGRTHLRDAMPVTFGQEFSSYLDEIKHIQTSINYVLERIGELPIGGTAVGTGINTPKGYIPKVIDIIRTLSKLNVKPAQNRFRAMKLLTDLLELSQLLNRLANVLLRLNQDLRLMFSGPFTGIGEIDIDIEIAGSSIMPGKKNPVTVEASILACVQVMGLNQSNNLLNLVGEFELSMGIPLMGYNIILQIDLMSEVLNKLSEHVLPRIKIRDERVNSLLYRSPALVTVISPIVGYDKATDIAKRIEKGENLIDVLKEEGFTEDQIKQVLNFEKLVFPHDEG